jgi:chromosome segregation ATPase
LKKQLTQAGISELDSSSVIMGTTEIARNIYANPDESYWKNECSKLSTDLRSTRSLNEDLQYQISKLQLELRRNAETIKSQTNNIQTLELKLQNVLSESQALQDQLSKQSPSTEYFVHQELRGLREKTFDQEELIQVSNLMAFYEL